LPAITTTMSLRLIRIFDLLPFDGLNLFGMMTLFPRRSRSQQATESESVLNFF
jgi:hypothetical protein